MELVVFQIPRIRVYLWVSVTFCALRYKYDKLQIFLDRLTSVTVKV